MDIFTIDKTNYSIIDTVEGIDTVVWIERFNSPSEFTLIGDPITLLETLPIGSFISTVNSEEIMVVESHFIDESLSKTPTKVQVKGRSVSAYIMDNRVISFGYPDNHAPPLPPYPEDLWNVDGIDGFSNYQMFYDISYNTSWFAVKNLLNEFLLNSSAPEGYENIPNLYITTNNLDGVYTDVNSIDANITKKLCSLSKAVYNILQRADIGLKVCRPGANRFNLEQSIYYNDFSEIPQDFTETLFFIIYRGIDRYVEQDVLFDFNNGDIANARYYWSIANKKNAFYSGNLTHTTRYFETDASGWDCKVVGVNSDDFVPSTELTSAKIWSILHEKGIDKMNRLNSRNEIVDAIGSEKAAAKYKIHYDLGDTVKVYGNYGVNLDMRIVEVAMIQDKERNDSIIPTMRIPYNIALGGGVG